MSAFLVSSFTTESMVSEFVVKFMTADDGVLWGKIGSLSLRLRDKRKVSGVRRFLIGHLDIAINGYDIAGDRMLGRRWKCSG